MKQPTEQETKEVWEWCEVEPSPAYPTGVEYPDIDLNNLFEYAVPKLIEKYKAHHIGFGWCGDGWLSYLNLEGEEGTVTHSNLIGDDQDPALALFWAIKQVMESEKCGTS